jgi:23S rRNA (uridine2552-2'-O)-methyltransferase
MKKIKLVKKHSHKSSRWLNRHLNDEYYLKSKTDGYRSRSSFKLIQINDRFDIFTKNFQNILDLGSAPGGWLQVAKKLTNNKSKIMGIDKLQIDEIEGVRFLQKDIFDNETQENIYNYFEGKIDIIMSDMSPNTTGNKSVDHLKIVSLIETVISISENHLKKNGHFICKIFQGGAQGELVKKLNLIFESIKYFKPKASRLESPETYIVGKKK